MMKILRSFLFLLLIILSSTNGNVIKPRAGNGIAESVGGLVGGSIGNSLGSSIGSSLGSSIPGAGSSNIPGLSPVLGGSTSPIGTALQLVPGMSSVMNGVTGAATSPIGTALQLVPGLSSVIGGGGVGQDQNGPLSQLVISWNLLYPSSLIKTG
ncbi:hypothetical protein DERP_014526 [Dermatophagoides pteronyssinus]|uniref:Uncharacterized protein n=1 Tax=Dermatophagoides pteronyssinus TaxID=6956 RepID=A0ABQ8JU17_DERPT|nr:hypothetical protein DERP_014526 [Dermatophagoides pteronyssinus]